jgi:hypothetical protein
MMPQDKILNPALVVAIQSDDVMEGGDGARICGTMFVGIRDLPYEKIRRKLSNETAGKILRHRSGGSSGIPRYSVRLHS